MVSSEYLAKVRFAVRRSPDEMVDAELDNLIEQCRADLIRVGVPPEVANNEGNYLVLGAVRCFVRWQFGIDGDNAERNHADYIAMADAIRMGGAD